MKKNNQKGFIILIIWSLLLILSVSYSVLSGIDWGNELTYVLIFNVRLPRVLLALVAGMGLTLAGQMFQIILNNTLADSFTLGLASGATLGAALATFLGLSFFWIVPLSMIGGFLSLILVMTIAYFIGYRGFSQSLILSGIMIGALMNALVFLLIQFNPKRLQNIMYYMYGGFSAAEYKEVIYITIALIIVVLCLLLQVSQIKLLQLDVDSGLSLGGNIQKVSMIVLLLATVLSTVIIGFTGIIGFIGIVIPQFIQRTTKRTLSYKMILNLLIGGTVMVLADVIGARLFDPIQLPASIVLAIIGIPMMFYLMIVERSHKLD
ncbi:FecCD family ABC transporter permease [Staphylococcus sp. 11261D007BR]